MAISMSKWMKATQLARRGPMADAMRLMQRVMARPSVTPRGYDAEVAAFRDLHAQRPQAPTVAPSAAAPVEQAVAEGSFTKGTFAFGGDRYAYRLFVPSTAGPLAEPMPVVVMLHGCKQDAADFALGTGMNSLALQRRCIVLYPEQLTKSNGMRCWNWFETAHQAREIGEPGMIAALTRHVLATRAADASRVYIAGLSAGGAMAVHVAALYPELFAAVGVHSGLPSGAARDMVSAFGAMRGEARPSRVPKIAPAPMPTIVFHGNADGTVHPDNGDRIADAALDALKSSGATLARSQRTEAAGGARRSAVRTIHASEEGKPYVEHWVVGAGPHAWSGGSAAGSYTDPQGPGASAAMLDFMLQHSRVLQKA